MPNGEIDFDKIPSITNTNEGNLSVTHLPLDAMHEALKGQGFDPIPMMKYVMGPNTNPLSLLGERQGNKGKFYENIGDHANTPFEMGYIHYPPNPDNPQANATLPSDVMHCHYTCDEMYIVLGGRITLCIDMQYENGNMGPLTGKTIDLDVGNASPDSIKELANIEGVIIYQKTDGSYFFSYTTKPGSYHIITYAVPGTQLLLIKKANRNWSGDGKWSDKIVLE